MKNENLFEVYELTFSAIVPWMERMEIKMTTPRKARRSEALKEFILEFKIQNFCTEMLEKSTNLFKMSLC